MQNDEEREAEWKRQKEMRKIAALKFNEQEEAIYKQSYTSFGKLILAEEKTAPKYSIGTADRNVVTGELITIPKDTPGPQYDVPDVTSYKFSTDHKWRWGSAKRPSLNNKEKYSYFNLKYDERNDFGAMPKKWKKTQGGDIPKEARVKYDFREKTPGPGRYDPIIGAVRPKSAAYYLGEKTAESAIQWKTGTTFNVGPGAYNVEKMKYPSKHMNFPVYSLGNATRKPLNNAPWTKHETYEEYHSFGKQQRSKKRFESVISFGKSTRDREKKRGVFSANMERAPTKVHIPMPKF